MNSTKAAVGEAHSKLILVGEHAVVYGKPAIALPFPLKARCRVEKIEGAVLLESSVYTGTLENVPIKMRGISACIKESLEYLKQPVQDLCIKIDSAIPFGRGLGSSAAVAIAVVRGLFFFFGKQISQQELFELVHIAETYAHGNPSGIDMVVCSGENPIWFERGKGASQIELGSRLYFVVGDTGRVGDTRAAVENVRKVYSVETEKMQKSLNNIEEIAFKTKQALIEGDLYLLGELLNRNQQELMILGVSDEGLNELTQAAIRAGALGAKLTGGGLGGCILALADSLQQAEKISKELIKAGACKSWYFSTAKDVLYEEAD